MNFVPRDDCAFSPRNLYRPGGGSIPLIPPTAPAPASHAGAGRPGLPAAGGFELRDLVADIKRGVSGRNFKAADAPALEP